MWPTNTVEMPGLTTDFENWNGWVCWTNRPWVWMRVLDRGSSSLWVWSLVPSNRIIGSFLASQPVGEHLWTVGIGFQLLDLVTTFFMHRDELMENKGPNGRFLFLCQIWKQNSIRQWMSCNESQLQRGFLYCILCFYTSIKTRGERINHHSSVFNIQTASGSLSPIKRSILKLKTSEWLCGMCVQVHRTYDGQKHVIE